MENNYKGKWVYIPSMDRAGLVEELTEVAHERTEPDELRVFAAKVLAPSKEACEFCRDYPPLAAAMMTKYHDMPIIETLNVALQVVILIDKIMPYLVRWWKMLFGSKEEKAKAAIHAKAAKAYKRAKVLLDA